jgi:hypothetical protein
VLAVLAVLMSVLAALTPVLDAPKTRTPSLAELVADAVCMMVDVWFVFDNCFWFGY